MKPRFLLDEHVDRAVQRQLRRLESKYVVSCVIHYAQKESNTLTPQSDHIAVYVPVSEVFPNVQSDFATFKLLLGGLSRTDTLFWSARLNLVISNPSVDHMDSQQFGLNQFLTTEEIDAVNSFVRKTGRAQRVMVFFRGQLLELIRWVTLLCDDHPGDGTTFEDPSIRRKFAQAALIASDIWAKRVYEGRFSIEDGIDLGRTRALGAIRKSLEATSLTSELPEWLGRGWSLFRDYFPRYYPAFNDEFADLTELSIEEYYICLCAIAVNFVLSDIGYGIFDTQTIGKRTQYRDVFQRYVALESQTANELQYELWSQTSQDISSYESAPSYNYRPLRARPIFRASDGRAIVLDSVFFSEKATVGPLFTLVRGQSRQKANEIFGAFGDVFERYACDILERMFPDILGAVPKRLTCNIHAVDEEGRQLEIDACLNDVTEIVIFEMKAVWLREDEILTEDYETYVRHLREKYGVIAEASENQRAKGIGQLARIIIALTSKRGLGQKREFSQVQLIYPVLLVHDPYLSAPVYGHFLASEFEALLAPDLHLPTGELQKGDLRVAPLIVMTIEDLENLENSIERFGFRDLLADYSKSCTDRLTSLHDFIASSEYKDRMYHNRRVLESGMELLERSRETIFPTKDKSQG